MDLIHFHPRNYLNQSCAILLIRFLAGFLCAALLDIVCFGIIIVNKDDIIWTRKVLQTSQPKNPTRVNLGYLRRINEINYSNDYKQRNRHMNFTISWVCQFFRYWFCLLLFHHSTQLSNRIASARIYVSAWEPFFDLVTASSHVKRETCCCCCNFVCFTIIISCINFHLYIVICGSRLFFATFNFYRCWSYIINPIRSFDSLHMYSIQ